MGAAVLLKLPPLQSALDSTQVRQHCDKHQPMLLSRYCRYPLPQHSLALFPSPPFCLLDTLTHTQSNKMGGFNKRNGGGTGARA